MIERRHGLWTWTLALAVAGIAGHARTQEPHIITPPVQTAETFKQFAAFFDILGKSYVEPGRIRPSEHTADALRAYLRSLDPEAALMPAPEQLMASIGVEGPLVDIGVSFSTRNRFPAIITTHEGSPAQAAGLLWGDEIRAINGQSLENADLAACYLRIWGAVDSQMELVVHDPADGQTRTLVIQRRLPVPVPAVAVKYIAGGTAYRRLPEFTVAAVESLREDLIRMEKERPRGLVLDLRNNPGGAFQAAQIAADMFLPAGAVIVAVDYPNADKHTVFHANDARKFNVPLVLLVNGGTSAEAEIFAAALRDNQRARLVGVATCGRGRKIEQFKLPDGMSLYIPVARYRPPSNKDYHGTGLAPDVAVNMPRDDERKLSVTGFGNFNWIENKRQVLDLDKTLARALELLDK